MEPDHIKKTPSTEAGNNEIKQMELSACKSGLVLFQCDAHDLQTELFLFFVPDQECDLL
jgi:hypothetical protein